LTTLWLLVVGVVEGVLALAVVLEDSVPEQD
jgi:hypothetical protein